MNSIKIIMLIAVIATLMACGPGLPNTSDYNLNVAGQKVYGVHQETDGKHNKTDVECATRQDCGANVMTMGQVINPALAVTTLQNVTMANASYNSKAVKCDLLEVVYDGKVIKVLPDGCKPADAREMEMVPTR